MRKSIVILMVLALVAFGLTSCSKSTSTTSTATAASSSSSAAATTSAPQKTAESIANVAVDTNAVEATSILSENTINIGYGTAIDSLTPFRSNTGRNAAYMPLLYETLGVMTEDVEVVPYAAKSWTTADNGLSYDIEIYDNITDSAGNHITASDIVWFINESKAKALKPNFGKVVSVEQTGDYTFHVQMKSNVVGAFQTLMLDTYVLSEKAFKESKDEFGLEAITTSPYKVVSFTPSAEIDFERRADYWQDIEKMPECVRPIQKKVNFSIITEAFQLGVALETGKVDAVVDLASSTGSQYVGNNAYTISLSDGAQGWQIFFSGADSSLVANNKALRQAIAYAIDEAGMVTAIASGYGTQMWDCCSPRLIGFNPAWKNEPYYQYDVNKAKELLKESGYAGQELVLLSTSSATASRLGQLIQGFCAQVGINIKINAVDMALYTATRLDGTQYDLTINTVGGLTMADYWATRFDPSAYKAGDATSRKDMVLGDMLNKTWTAEGYTQENIDAVHEYIKDSCIAYGMVNPSIFTIWSNKLKMDKVVSGGLSGYVQFQSCQITK